MASSVLNAANVPISGYASALAEALAVRALVYGRIVFVGAYRDTVQGAVVCAAGVVFALLHRAADRHICMSIRHNCFPPWFGLHPVCARSGLKIHVWGKEKFGLL